MPRTLTPLEALLLESLREVVPYAESRCEDLSDAWEAIPEPDEREEARRCAELAWERLSRAASITQVLTAAFATEVSHGG